MIESLLDQNCRNSSIAGPPSFFVLPLRPQLEMRETQAVRLLQE